MPINYTEAELAALVEVALEINPAANKALLHKTIPLLERQTPATLRAFLDNADAAHGEVEEDGSEIIVVNIWENKGEGAKHGYATRKTGKRHDKRNGKEENLSLLNRIIYSEMGRIDADPFSIPRAIISTENWQAILEEAAAPSIKLGYYISAVGCLQQIKDYWAAARETNNRFLYTPKHISPSEDDLSALILAQIEAHATFGAAFKFSRLCSGFSQKALTEVAGVPQTTISSWERNLGAPSASQLAALCNAMGHAEAVRDALNKKCFYKQLGVAVDQQPCFGKLLQAYRKIAELHQNELAEAVGAAQTTISNWERNLAAPSASQLAALCNAMGLEEAAQQRLCTAYVAAIWGKATKLATKAGTLDTTNIGLFATKLVLAPSVGSPTVTTTRQWHEEQRGQPVPPECVQPLADLAKVMLRTKHARDGQPTP